MGVYVVSSKTTKARRGAGRGRLGCGLGAAPFDAANLRKPSERQNSVGIECAESVGYFEEGRGAVDGAACVHHTEAGRRPDVVKNGPAYVVSNDAQGVTLAGKVAKNLKCVGVCHTVSLFGVYNITRGDTAATTKRKTVETAGPTGALA